MGPRPLNTMAIGLFSFIQPRMVITIQIIAKFLTAGMPINHSEGRSGGTSRPLFTRTSAFAAAPVLGRRRKDGIAPGCLRRAVQRVRSRAPDCVMRRGAMRLDRRLVAVDLVEVVDVRVLLV